MRKVFLLLTLIFCSAVATAQVSTFKAVLTGAGEAPAAADPNSSGFAVVGVDPTAGTVTFTLFETNLSAAPTAAHIHRAPAGVAAAPLIPFNAPFTSGVASGTVTGVAASLINDIIANPANFCVNIHTSAFPGGAIRGQLSAAPGTFVGPILFVPVVAKVIGLQGENFVDDIRLVNRSAVSSNVTLDFFASNSAGLSAPTATHGVTVAANSQLILNDVLGSTFATSGIGALRITADKDVVALSRLLNDQRGVGLGSTGMALLASRVEDTCRSGQLGLLSNGSASDISSGVGFRTNIGYFNTTTASVTIAFTARKNDGTSFATKTVTVPGFSHAQFRLSDLFDSASASDLKQDDFFVTFTVTGGPTLVYAVIADNKTGDSYLVLATCS